MREVDLSGALVRLAVDQPFFGTLLAMTPLIEDGGTPSLATDGERVYYNPAYLAGLTVEETVGALTHELLHIVYFHCDRGRRAGREPGAWNAAADFAVNQELASWKFKLPKGALLDRRYHGMTAEQIDEILPPGPWRCLDALMPTRPGRGDGIKGRIIAAYEASRGHGRLPDGLEAAIGRIRDGRVAWERVLHDFLGQALAREQESYLPPNRRHLWDQRYLPGPVRGRRRSLAVAVDTSASIDGGLMERFAAELKGIAGLCDSLLVLTCDAAVRQSVELAGLSRFLAGLKFTGRGGTDFRPVFQYIKDKMLAPDALLYLTDGEGHFPAAAPRLYPVLWCLSGNVKTPWGKSLTLWRGHER